MEQKRVTQKDVAKAAGVTRPAVSLALKNRSSISPATRERILRCAEKLGYRPDPMLTALAAYRWGMQPSAFHGTIAWLTNVRPGHDWQRIPTYRDYYKGATRQAEFYGYKLEIFDLAARGMNADRMTDILRARNINAILLCPQLPASEQMDFSWEHFSVVTFGYTLRRPDLHTITTTQYRAVRTCMQQLRARGYRRIGFAVTPRHDERIDHNYLAGYLVEQHVSGADQSVLPWDGVSAESLGHWLKTFRPDAIITGDYKILDVLKELKVRVPETLGVACPLLGDATSALSGVFEDSVAVGGAGVDMLVGLVHRSERGIPSLPRRLHIEGRWVEGKTLRPLRADEPVRVG